MIDERMWEGVQMLKEKYEVEEVAVGDFANIRIQQMDYEVTQYDVKDVGNLVIMTCRESDAMQMDSFVLTPYYKNLPLFSTDYIYMKEHRCFLNEIYSVVVHQDQTYQSYMEAFRKVKEKYRSLPDMPMKPCWYDEIRPVCIAKMANPSNDMEILHVFYENLKIWVAMEKELSRLSKEEYQQKWTVTKQYADQLVDRGGVSTDVFKSILGAQKTKQFFHTVFFGAERYRKA